MEGSHAVIRRQLGTIMVEEGFLASLLGITPTKAVDGRVIDLAGTGGTPD